MHLSDKQACERRQKDFNLYFPENSETRRTNDAHGKKKMVQDHLIICVWVWVGGINNT